jgi:NAD(P)-dependent dehydrogenase (short-subunit alcohol dehydrogenase family)
MKSDIYASLKGKTALVTGAGLGIGAALSQALGELGASVICASRTQTDIDETAQSITHGGGRALAVGFAPSDKGYSVTTRAE